MAKKLMLTSENIDMINGILETFGYESTLRIMNGNQYGTLSKNENSLYVRLSYSTFEGFFVSVTGNWLYSSESITEYTKELQVVDRLFSMIEANI